MIIAMTGLRRWLAGKGSCSSGQTLVEYSLILALISLVILATFQTYVSGASGLVTYVGNQVQALLGSGS